MLQQSQSKTDPVVLQVQVRRGFGDAIRLLFQTQWEPLLEFLVRTSDVCQSALDTALETAVEPAANPIHICIGISRSSTEGE